MMEERADGPDLCRLRRERRSALLLRLVLMSVAVSGTYYATRGLSHRIRLIAGAGVCGLGVVVGVSMVAILVQQHHAVRDRAARGEVEERCPTLDDI